MPDNLGEIALASNRVVFNQKIKKIIKQKINNEGRIEIEVFYKRSKSKNKKFLINTNILEILNKSLNNLN